MALNNPLISVPGVAQVAVVDRVPPSGNPSAGRALALSIQVETYSREFDATFTPPNLWVVAFKWVSAGTMQWCNAVRTDTKSIKIVGRDVWENRQTLTLPLPGLSAADKVCLFVFHDEWPGILGRDVSLDQLKAEIKAHGTKTALFVAGSAPFGLGDKTSGGVYSDEERGGDQFATLGQIGQMLTMGLLLVGGSMLFNYLDRQ